MSNVVKIREVGLRDGLQLIKSNLSTESKLMWINKQVSAGFTEMEVTSFVPPKLLPQFSDASEIIIKSNKIKKLKPTALILNIKGAIRAIEAGTKKITFVLSASEKHNLSNVNCTTDQSLSMFNEIIEVSKDTKVEVAAAIATSFGCSIQGSVPEIRVLELAKEMAKKGACEINLADTVGYANPKQVKALFGKLKDQIGNVPMAAHFHDTRGMGLANVVAALQEGVRRFDSTMAGLGGCPFAPGASGNIATEDCVYLLESLGFNTSVNVDKLLELRHYLTDLLPNEKLEGRLGVAGTAINFKKKLL
jgi:hydroxymethylglutaryl-CoA lyase